MKNDHILKINRTGLTLTLISRNRTLLKKIHQSLSDPFGPNYSEVSPFERTLPSPAVECRPLRHSSRPHLDGRGFTEELTPPQMLKHSTAGHAGLPAPGSSLTKRRAPSPPSVTSSSKNYQFSFHSSFTQANQRNGKSNHFSVN